MDLAEGRQKLGPEAQGAAAAGVIPGRRLRSRLQRVRADAARSERRDGIGLHEIGVGRAARIVPALWPGGTGAHAGRHLELPLGRVVAILRAHFEERAVGEAAIGVSARGGEEIGQERRPHLVELGADRIGEPQHIGTAAEEPRLGRGQEREGRGFDEPARRERAAHEFGAALGGIERGLRQRRLARERHGGNVLEARDAQHLLDEIGLALDVGAPGRRHDGPRRSRPRSRSRATREFPWRAPVRARGRPRSRRARGRSAARGANAGRRPIAGSRSPRRRRVRG